MDYDQKMDQRVKALEYEIKILKNEIQRTLLDIQEQILVHYYPDLRADEASADQEGAMHTIESIASKKAQMDSTASVTRKAAAAKASATKPAPTPVVSSAQPEPMAPESPAAEPAPAQSRVSPSVALSPEPEAEPPVTVKSVSLDQLRAGTDGPTMSKQVNYREQPPSVTEPVTVPEDAEPDEVEVDTAALSAWVTDTVGQVGVDRTVTIINTAVKRGLLPSEHKDIMVRLTDRADESQVPEKLAINKVLNAILALQQAMGQQTNPDEAINLIDEANLG